MAVIALVVVAAIIYMTEGQRRIPVQYAKRVVGRKVYGGQSTYLPLRINMAGVIPVIFASSVLLFPVTLAQMTPWSWAKSLSKIFGPGSWWYLAGRGHPDHPLHLLLHGRAVQPHRPSRQPEEVRRLCPRHPSGRPDGGLSRPGADPHHASRGIVPGGHRAAATRRSSRGVNVPFYFGGTSLLIVVGRGARYDEADGIPAAHAALRRLPQVGLQQGRN